MADTGMLIRISANLTELKKNLADGTATINTTTAAMTKLASGLEGNRLIQQAQNIVAAVNQIGGVTKLTESEQARLNVTLEKAIEKYAALGKQAPAEMTKLAEQTRGAAQAGEGMSAWLGKATGLLSAFGVTLSLGAMVQFGRQILADADALVKLHDQTGISLTGLQAMRIAGDDAGVSLTAMTAAATMLQKRLGGDDDSTIAALKDLGIEVVAFKQLDGAAQMSAIADAIKEQHDPLRVAADLSAIYGRGWAETLPVLKRGFEELKTGTAGMSEETIRTLDNLGDAFGKFYRDLKAAAGTALSDSIRIFTDPLGWKEQARLTADQLEKVTDKAKGAMTAMGAVAPPGLPADLKEIEASLTKNAEALMKVTQEAEKAAAAYRKLMSDVKNAEGMAQMDAMADTLKRAAQNQEGLWLMERDAWQMQLETRQKAEVQAGAQAAAEAALAAEIGAGLTIVGELPAAHAAAGAAAVDGTAQAAQGYSMMGGQIAIATGNLAALTRQEQQFIAVWNQSVAMGQSVGNAYALAATGASFSGNSVSLGGGRAGGGPVSSGTPYMVGERGPELFVPSSAGSIVPNGGGGSTSVTIASGAVQINYPLMNDPRARMEIAAFVGDAIMARLRQQGVRVPSGV